MSARDEDRVVVPRMHRGGKRNCGMQFLLRFFPFCFLLGFNRTTRANRNLASLWTDNGYPAACVDEGIVWDCELFEPNPGWSSVSELVCARYENQYARVLCGGFFSNHGKNIAPFESGSILSVRSGS